jgi:anti-sigma B factor antagonist
LVEAFQSARKVGIRFALVSVSDAAMRVLQLARLDRIFSIHASLDDALADSV